MCKSNLTEELKMSKNIVYIHRDDCSKEDDFEFLDSLDNNYIEYPSGSSYMGDNINRIIGYTTNKANKLIKKIPAFINYLSSLKPQQLFDLGMSGTAESLYKSGKLILKMRKDGNGFLPILCDKSGKFFEQVNIKPNQMKPQLAEALNSMAVQQQLSEILDSLEEMNLKIESITQGQRNDRIGLYYSARQQYIEALNIKDSILKQQALMNVIKTANDARFLLMETMKTDIKFIMSKNSNLFNDSKASSKEIEDKLMNIRESFKLINDATGICALSYTELDENEALKSSLCAYKNFIQQCLLNKNENNKLPYECLQQWDNLTDNMWLYTPKIVFEKLEKFTVKIKDNLCFKKNQINQINMFEEEI